jgi:hypothetical protein
MEVLIIGEEPQRSAPVRTLAEALRFHGVGVRFSHGVECVSTRAWVNEVLRADCVVCVTYHGFDFLVRQIALAAALGRPVVRWWVGTDVLLCLEEPAVRSLAERLDRCVALNIAVAPHLVEELASVGIQARFVPSVLEPRYIPDSSVSPTRSREILVYMPTGRGEFYREETIRQVIARNPDHKFVVVGDERHRFGQFANVRSLGWVEDMRPVLDQVGALLRITQHDGLPRMVLESLLRSHFVIYSWPLAGCWEARTAEEVQAALTRLRAAPAQNHEGREAALELLRPDPAVVFRDLLKRVCRRPPLHKRLSGGMLAGRQMVAARWQWVRSVMSGAALV